MSTWQRANRNAQFYAGFTRYVEWLVSRHFCVMRVRNGSKLPTRGGYIGVANHHSWWDGFVALILHRRENDKRPFSIMMSDRELMRFPYFRMLGAFSVDASSVRAARESIVYAAEEARAGAGVWLLPDGILRPPQTPLAFTAGFVHAARRADVPILPMAMRFVFLGRRQPEILVAIGELVDAHRLDAQLVAQRSVESLLQQIDEDCLSGTLDAQYSAVVRGRSKL